MVDFTEKDAALYALVSQNADSRHVRAKYENA